MNYCHEGHYASDFIVSEMQFLEFRKLTLGYRIRESLDAFVADIVVREIQLLEIRKRILGEVRHAFVANVFAYETQVFGQQLFFRDSQAFVDPLCAIPLVHAPGALAFRSPARL